MIGTTSSINHIILQDINNYNNLAVWLDGTDFLNHGVDQRYTITNGNNFNLLVTLSFGSITVPTYYKSGGASRAYSIIITPASLPNYNTLTMTAWGKYINSSNWTNLFTCGNDSTAFMEARLRWDTDGTVGYYAPSGSSYILYSPAVGFAKNTWAFFAVVLNGSEVRLYFNNNCIYTTTISHSRNSIATWHLLGDTCYTSDSGGTSYCTDYRCYNIALSDSDILEIYNAGPQLHR